jgi:long-chain acyl-CoA synthetase
VPNTDTLKEFVKAQGIDPATEEGKQAMLQKIQDEVNEYRNGKFAGMFPEQWLPKAIAVLPEAFTEQNHMVNSTMKIVRGKVEEYYADRIAYAYTPEGKELLNEQNIASLG